MKAVVTDRPSSYTPTSAVAVALRTSPGIAAQATTITVAHVILSKLDAPTPRDIPTWMITFHGITDYPTGAAVSPETSPPPSYPPVRDMKFTVFLGENGEYVLSSEYGGHR